MGGEREKRMHIPVGKPGVDEVPVIEREREIPGQAHEFRRRRRGRRNRANMGFDRIGDSRSPRLVHPPRGLPGGEPERIALVHPIEENPGQPGHVRGTGLRRKLEHFQKTPARFRADGGIRAVCRAEGRMLPHLEKHIRQFQPVGIDLGSKFRSRPGGIPDNARGLQVGTPGKNTKIQTPNPKHPDEGHDILVGQKRKGEVGTGKFHKKGPLMATGCRNFQMPILPRPTGHVNLISPAAPGRA